VHRSARDFARRHGDAIALDVELEDGRRLGVSELRSVRGETFVTLSVDERELAVRLDRIVGVELTPARAGARRFRTREAGSSA
jgi:ribosome maturation factor RimP